MDHSDPLYRLIVPIIYGTGALITFLILCIELKTLYRTLHFRETLEMIKVASSTPTVSPTPATPSTTVSSTPIPQKEKTSPPPKEKEPKLFLLLPIFSHFFNFIMSVVGILTVLGIPYCIVTAYSGPIAYAIAKTFMYFVFIYRLRIVYSRTMFAYNGKFLWNLFLIVSFCSFCLIIASIFTLDFQIVYNRNNEPVCIANVHSLVLLVTIIFDIIISFLCCYLFIRPLIILNKDGGDEDVRQIVLRYLVLTCVSVGTTFLLLILMAILKMTSLVTFDVIINCVCIALFNKHYHHYFKIICCGPMFVCNELCRIKSKRTSDDINNL